MSKTVFIDNEEVGDTWLIRVAATLEPSAKVMKCKYFCNRKMWNDKII